mgnify:CR=1 FL=1
MATADRHYHVEDCSAILMQTRDGAIGTIEASWSSPGSANVVEVYGTDGAVVIDYAGSGLRALLHNASEWQEIPSEAPDRFVLQARHFIECARGERTPIVDGTDGLRAQEVAEAAYSFAKDGAWNCL